MTTDEYFIDETRTGASAAEFRGLGRATIAARWPLRADLDWLRAVMRQIYERVGSGVEVKSNDIVSAMTRDQATAKLVDAGIGRAEIAIVDFHLVIQDTLHAICDVFGLDPRQAGSPEQIVEQGQLPPIFVRQMLDRASRTAVEWSVVPQLENMLRRAVQAGLSRPGPAYLVDRDELNEMKGQAKQEAISRVATALGEALHPETIAAATEQAHSRWAPLGAISVASLETATQPHKTYDKGHASAFRVAKAAHQRVSNRLRLARDAYLQPTVSPGCLRQADSARIFGLTAADLAAAVARNTYELYGHDRSAGARAVAGRFDRVLLNDEWIL